MLRSASVVLAAYAVCACASRNPQPLPSAEPKIAWLAAVTSTETARVTAVALTASGDAVIAGEFSGTLAIGEARALSAGKSDGFVARLDAAGGRVRWLRRLGGEGDDRIASVAVSADGRIAIGGELSGEVRADASIRVVGRGKPDGFAGQLAEDGSITWIKALGCSRYGVVSGVTFTADGDTAVVGFFAGEISLLGRPIYSAGLSDLFVARFDRRGAARWLKRGGGPGADLGKAIAASSDGGIAIAGAIMDGAQLGAHVVTVQDPASNLLLAVLDSDGSFNSVAHGGGSGNDSAEALVWTTDAVIAGGHSVPALVRRGDDNILESATPLPDIARVTALAFSAQLFVARAVGNPSGVGSGVAISRGVLIGQTETVSLAATESIVASGLAADSDSVIAVGSVRGTLSTESRKLTSDGDSFGFVAAWTWPR